ncbi:MAG: arylsulfatase [Bryobacterales bacterium]|nr:arylsulfatase [Bryobacterales bacterium]
MLRRSFLSLAAAAPAAATSMVASRAAAQATGTGSSRPPNIIWIMADDMAWADAGCYGQRVIQTPHIDSLARDGMRFTDAYAGCTVCAPSRSVLMTGLHTGHTPVRSNPGGVYLLDEETTVGEVLRPAGYKNGCFGKWGLGDIGTPGVPWKQGFDEFYGYLHQAHAHYYYPPYLHDNDKEAPFPANKGLKTGTHVHNAIEDRTVEFIRKNRNNPFFCYAAWTPPHWEPAIPYPDMEPYRDRFHPEHSYSDRGGRLNPQPETYAAYCGMVARIDHGVGRILRLLKELNLEENTLVFFTSDNGGHSRAAFDARNRLQNYGPFRGNKTTMYEGGLRVPMLARWPNRIPAGKVSSFPWMFMDAMPTFADVAGVSTPANIDGHSLVPTLRGEQQTPHDYLYWELTSFESSNLPNYEWKDVRARSGHPPQALRMGDWKAVRPKHDAPMELYNLKQDIRESKDLAAKEPETLARLQQTIASARTDPRPQSQPTHRWFGKPWW